MPLSINACGSAGRLDHSTVCLLGEAPDRVGEEPRKRFGIRARREGLRIETGEGFRAEFVRVSCQEMAEFLKAPDHGFIGYAGGPAITAYPLDELETMRNDHKGMPSLPPRAQKSRLHLPERAGAQLGVPVVAGPILKIAHGKFVHPVNSARLEQKLVS